MALIVTRKELKYAISDVEYFKYVNLLSVLLTPDKSNGEVGYNVRSLYFDGYNNDDYYAKMDGIEVRKKIRLRVYNPKDEKVKLELKKKIGVNQTKETITITREDAKALIDLDYSVLLKYEEKTARTIYNIMTIGGYRPKVLVEYKRRAYIHTENRIRITLDSEIRKSEFEFDLFDEDVYLAPTFNQYDAVLEVKFDGELFKWITDLLKGNDCIYESISKYSNSREFFDNYLA
ncbi:MAG: polyphosphate polymerase domain-containing protein [Clostridium sp.]|uniref:polyphosphate polymerase domain-containing protein n=1 Tax=Clostridium sp. TaxID=1506 RepID=UPI003F2E8426